MIVVDDINYAYSLAEKRILVGIANEYLAQNKALSKADFVNRLNRGEPIQYITNQAYFYRDVYYVNSNVLIPRPETEELVDYVVKNSAPKKIIDLGTGSGCIAIALKKYLNTAEVYALDISDEALDVCRKNAINLKADINVIKGDILSLKMQNTFDLIISNPPYVGETEVLESSVHHFEPHLALYSPEDPLKFYKAIASFAKTNLSPNGEVLVEINKKFGQETLSIFNGFKAEIIQDFSGNDRFIKAIIS